METHEVTKKWHEGELEREDISDILSSTWSFLINPSQLGPVGGDKFDHIVDGLMSIYRFSKKDYPPGGFVKAVLKDSLREAVRKADSINEKALRVYVWFIDNCIPIGDVKEMKVKVTNSRDC